MNTPSFARIREAATAADVVAVEQRYGFTLPADYVAHILAVNGGSPQPDRFETVDAAGEPRAFVVNKFYSVKHGGSSALETALEDLRDQIHPDLVPFADDAGGDQFCLSVGPEDYGAVYYISHESYVPPFKEETYDEATDEYVDAPPPGPRQYGEGVYPLAPSFTAFLAGLVAGTPA